MTAVTESLITGALMIGTLALLMPAAALFAQVFLGGWQTERARMALMAGAITGAARGDGHETVPGSLS